jgi:hypothetical protein
MPGLSRLRYMLLATLYQKLHVGRNRRRALHWQPLPESANILFGLKINFDAASF